MKRILHVDDFAMIRALVKRWLEPRGVVVDSYASLREAKAAYDPAIHKVAVVDGSIDSQVTNDGAQWAYELHKQHRNVIIFSSEQYSDIRSVVKPNYGELIDRILVMLDMPE